jgi:ABC-type phosphate transport system permease subunit
MTRMRIRGEWPRRIAAAVVVGAAALVPAQTLAQGCAMCATYLSNGRDPSSEAFKISILFLMAMPFVVVGSAGAWILWMYRRNRPRQPALRVLRAEQEGMG